MSLTTYNTMRVNKNWQNLYTSGRKKKLYLLKRKYRVVRHASDCIFPLTLISSRVFKVCYNFIVCSSPPSFLLWHKANYPASQQLAARVYRYRERVCLLLRGRVFQERSGLGVVGERGEADGCCLHVTATMLTSVRALNTNTKEECWQ